MALNDKQKIFIREMVLHGDENKAVIAAYPHLQPTDRKLIRTYCGRLMKNVEISTEIQQQAAKVQQMAQEKAAELLKDEIVSTFLTVKRKREILQAIAEGTLQIPTQKVVWDKDKEKYVKVPVLEIPDHSARMQAIALDNKMTGDDAAVKFDHTTKGKAISSGVNYEALTDSVLDALIAAEVKTTGEGED